MASSTPLPPSPLSSRHKINYIRLWRLITDFGQTVLRRVFDSFHPPADLQTHLNSPAINNVLKGLKSRKILNTQQWGKLYPPPPGVPESTTFDITLLFLLLRNTCGLTPPTTGWDAAPSPSDFSKEADLIRIKHYRNQIIHDNTEFSDADFETLWAEIEVIMIRLGGPQHKTQIQRLKIESLKPGSEAFCSLPQQPSHITVYRSTEVSTIMSEIQRLQLAYPDEITVTYLSGNPGCGKSELARQVGKMFFEEAEESAKCVSTLNASNLESLTLSYMDLAEKLRCSEISLSTVNSMNSQEQKLTRLRGIISTKLHSYSSWLMIVDNVEDLQLVSKFLPQAGENLQHGYGHVIITTQDGLSIPLRDPHAHHMPLRSGMVPADAVEALLEISGCSGGEEIFNSVAKELDLQPLALACAAVYVQEVHMTDHTMTWEKYLQHTQKHDIESTERIYEETNNSYKMSMTNAVKMAVQKVIEKSQVMHHTFEFLAAMAPDFISLHHVVNYVLKCLPDEDEKLVAAKIIKSSLVLTSKDKDEPTVRVHQVVLNVLESVVQELHCNEEDELSYLTKVIDVFSYLDTMDKNSIDYIKSTVKLSKHVVSFSIKIKVFFERRKILILTEKNKYGVRYKLNRTSTIQYQTIIKILKKRLSQVLREQEKDEIHRCLLEICVALTITNPDTIMKEDHEKIFSSGERNYDVYEPKEQHRLINNFGFVLKRLGDYHEAKQCYEKSLEMAKTTLGNNHIEVAATLNNLGTLMINLCKFEEAEGYFRKAIGIYEHNYGSKHPNVALSLYNLGCTFSRLGKYDEAKVCHEKSLDINKREYGDEHPIVAADLDKIGIVLSDLGRCKEAKECHQEALAINESTYGNNHRSVAISLNNIGSVLSKLGSYKEAKECHQKALAIYESTYENNHPDVATSLSHLGSVLSDLGSYKDAKECHQKALAIYESTYGNNHPDVAISLNNLGLVLTDLGSYKEAKGCYQKALAINKSKYGSNHSNVAAVLGNLGIALRDLGEFDKSKECIERALVIDKSVFDENHPHIGIDLYKLGLSLHPLGLIKEAKESFERSITILEASCGEGHPRVARTLNGLGQLQMEQGDNELAKQNLDRALAINEKSLGANHPEVAETLNNLGRLSQSLHEYEEARRYFERALAINEETFDENHPKIAITLNNL